MSLTTSLSQPTGLNVIFEDPISFELMENAVITNCGHSFSDSTLKDWFESKKSLCPICSKPLRVDQVTPNYKLREAIATYKRIQEERTHELQTIMNASTSPPMTTSTTSTLHHANPLVIDFRSPDRHASMPVIGTPLTDFSPDSYSDISSDEEDGFSSPRSMTSYDEDDVEQPKLIIDVLKARDLVNKDFWGAGKPYVTIEFGGEKRQTRPIKNNLCPIWNETFIFNVHPDIENTDILVQIWDSDKLIGSSFLGQVKISLEGLKESKKVCKSYALEKRTEKSKVKGDIKLRLIYLDPKASLAEKPKKKKPVFNTQHEEKRDLRAEIASLHLNNPPQQVKPRSGTLPAYNSFSNSVPVLPSFPQIQPQPVQVPPVKPRIPIRLPPICRWFTQGSCRNGDNCANLHERALPSQVVPREDLIGVLVGMGFDKGLVEYLLKRCRNHLATATTLLLTDFNRLNDEFHAFKGVV